MKKKNSLLYINFAMMPQNRFWAPQWPQMGTLGTFLPKSVGTVILGIEFDPRIRFQKKVNIYHSPRTHSAF